MIQVRSRLPAPEILASDTDSRDGWLGRVVGETWPIVAVILLLTVEMAHIESSGWRVLLLYDGDSLTLAMVWKDVVAGVPLHLVGTSQLFVFPEALIYLVARLIGGSVRGSFVAGAYVTMLALYGVLRFTATIAVVGSAQRRRAASLLPVLLILGLMLLERQPGGPLTVKVATPLLFSTYYCGVILVGVWSSGLGGRQLGWRGRSALAKTLAVSLVIGATTISDPLYAVQIAAPLILTLVILRLLGAIGTPSALMVSLPQALGVLIYVVSKPALSMYDGASLSRYDHPLAVGVAADTISRTLWNNGHTGAGAAEVVMVATAWLVVTASTVRSVRRRFRSPHSWTEMDTAELIIKAFSATAAVTIFPVVIITGNSAARYFLPTVILPVVGLLPVLGRVHLRVDVLRTARPVLAMGLIVFAAMASPDAGRLLSAGRGPYGESCLETALHRQPAYGVGEYWAARPLALYNADREQVLQVDTSFRAYAWADNVDDYLRHPLTFVIVDGGAQLGGAYQQPSRLRFLITAATVTDLIGTPSRSIACPGFHVDVFPPGTPGYFRLNLTVQTSARAYLLTGQQ